MMWPMSTSTRSVEEFREAVTHGLTGAPVLAVISEPGLGSLFELGVFIPLGYTLDNPTLPDRLRSFRGSESLYVRCPWELNSPRELVPPGTLLKGHQARMKLLEALVGEPIKSVQFKGSGLGLQLELPSGLSLQLFPHDRGHGSGGYTVGLEGDYWSTYEDGTVALWTASA
jgi:hypothetical protein